MRRLLIAVGILVLGALVFMPIIGATGLGGLPGDFTVNVGNTAVYMPLASSLIASVVLSLLFLILRK